MLNSSETALQIFEALQVDFSLPKHAMRSRSQEAESGSNSVRSRSRFPVMRRVGTGGSVAGQPSVDALSVPHAPSVISPGAIMTVSGTGTITGFEWSTKKPSLYDKIFNRKKLRIAQKQQLELSKQQNFSLEQPAISDEEQQASKMSVEDFFKSVKNSAEELELLHERYKNYEAACEHLRKTGQEALLEVMELELEIYRAESQLYAVGFRQVVTEKQMVEFAKNSKRGIRLDWIKNFVRSIPQKAVDAKITCDQHCIFDNYVICHYDPNNTGSVEEEDKDPILFGIIAGSTKLYYIACWVDEFCDLTFDKLVESIGAEAITANNITAEVMTYKQS